MIRALTEALVQPLEGPGPGPELELLLVMEEENQEEKMESREEVEQEDNGELLVFDDDSDQESPHSFQDD